MLRLVEAASTLIFFTSPGASGGRLDKLAPDKLDPLINGLDRAVGRAENTASEVVQEPGRSFGDVFALHEIWRAPLMSCTTLPVLSMAGIQGPLTL